ncbi:MAG: hypothetical protein V2J24_11480, partial [Pseudomonadales bacterium]|nr:hypothetical protein [Pseudomonadales bacterium]
MRPLDLLIALLRRWVRPTILDAEPVRAGAGTIHYVLPSPSILDRAAVELATGTEALPPARTRTEDDARGAARRLFSLARSEGLLWRRPSMRRRPVELDACLAAARHGEDVVLVPVSVFWGRAPDRENSLLRLLLSERWTATSGL